MRFFSKLVLVCMLFIAIACEKEESKNVESAEIQTLPEGVANIEVVDGMLSFANDTVMYDAIVALSTMSPDERAKWEKQKGFESMQTLCDQITNELDQVEDEAGFYKVRSAYDSFVYFGEPNTDDQAFYVPLEKMLYSQVVDVNGTVKVGNEVKNFKSPAVMNRIKEMNNPLKAYGDDLASCKKFRSKDRQLLCLLEESTPGNVHLYVSSQKHSWWRGWINNSSLKQVKNTGSFAVYFAHSLHFGTISNKCLPGQYYDYGPGDVEYLHLYFRRDLNVNYSFLIFGNSFLEHEGCTLTLNRGW